MTDHELGQMQDYEDKSYQEDIEMTNELILREEQQYSLGQLMFDNPGAMVEQAKVVATVLKDVITSQKLYTNIQGKNYVHVEGWTTLGAILGITPRCVSVEEAYVFEGAIVSSSRPIPATGNVIFNATVELVRNSDGMIVGQGIAECGDSDTWKNRDRYAKKSMAITRATGKAFRLSYSWIIKLAGYEGTPMEEMPAKKKSPTAQAKKAAPKG